MHGLRICNGRLGSDLGIGNYTYVGSSGKSVVDYLLVNPFLLDHFLTFEIGEKSFVRSLCNSFFCEKQNT